MSLALSNESKNSLSITNNDKASSYTWADHGETSDEATASWAESGAFPVVLESKHYFTGKAVAELLLSEVSDKIFETSVILPDGTLVKNTRFTDSTGLLSLEVKN